MAVALDALMTAGNSSDGDSRQGDNVTSLSGTGITVGGSASLLVASIVISGGGGHVTSLAMTWNGVAMTAGPAIENTSSFLVHVAIFYLASPASGSNTLAATWTSATYDVYMSAMSFTGSDLTTPVVTADNQTNTATTSITVTSTTDGATVAASVKSSGDPTTNQTTWWKNSPFDPGGGATYALGGTSNTHTFTYGGGSNQANAGMHIQAAAGGGGATSLPEMESLTRAQRNLLIR